MNQFWNRLTRFYNHRTGMWTMAMLLCLSFLPTLLKTLIMVLRQNALPAWIVLAADLAGWTGAWLLLSVAVRLMAEQPAGHFLKGAWQFFRSGGLWLIAAGLALDAGHSLYLQYGARLNAQGSTLLYLGGLILVSLVICLVLSAVVFRMLAQAAAPGGRSPLGRTLAYWFRRPLLILGSAGAIAAVLFLIPLFYDSLLKNFPGLSLSFLELAAGSVLLCWLQWLVLQPLLLIMLRHARQIDSANAVPTVQNVANVPIQPAMPGAATSKWPALIRRQLSAIIALAVILAAGSYQLISGNPLTAVAAIRQDIQNNLTYINLMAASGDPAAAAYYHRSAEARVLAWQGAVLEKSGALQQALNLAPADEQVQLLNAWQSGSPLSALEQGFLNGNHSKAWYLALLDAYADNKNLNNTQKLRQAELLRICLLQGYYSSGAVMPADLKHKKDALADMLNDMLATLNSSRHFALVARAGEEGGVNQQLVLDALSLAETYPDQIQYQYLAMTYGSNYLDDSATHYARTVKAALNYDELYMEQNGDDLDEKVLLTEKMTVAKALMACGDPAACADFLEDVSPANESIAMMRANALFSLDQFEPCLKATAVILKKQPDNLNALYLSALCSLQLREYADSLGYAAKLADLTKKAKNPLEAERLLYPYLLRLTLSESTYNLEAYSKLSEAEMAQLKKNEFLYQYATALHLWAVNSEESRKEALQYLDQLLKANDQLSRAIYLRGAIYFEQQQDKQALEAFNASLALDDAQPTVWYALANLYDRSGQYPEAYAACQKVLAYLPSSDHDYDVFGVSVHASGLMNKLKPYVKEGK